MILELILGIVATWIIVKTSKTIIAWIKEKKVSLRVLFYDGGMPSSHTASITSVTTGIFLETGLSVIFVLGVIITLIIINDALKVRKTTEDQSKVLNKLQKEKKLDEHIGHTIPEVIVGLILGIIIPVIVFALI